MYKPPQFELTSAAEMYAVIRACGLAQFVTGTAVGLLATPLPLFLDESQGELGTLYGHLARANDQWKSTPEHEALAIFPTADAYISPAWYTTKAETGKVVPTWNYETVHAYGKVEFVEDPQRLLDVVTRLTDLHECKRPEPWRVTDAPSEFIHSQLRGIVGVRMPITRMEGKQKMSQNRNEADRAGVVEGLSQSDREGDLRSAKMVPLKAG